MKTMRKSVCLMLVIAIVIGCFVPAFAEEEPKETIRIVTLGDSNMTGYGLNSFRDDPECLKSDGFGYRVAGSYPDLLAKKFEENGYDVKLTPLAMSALRAYDLRLLMDPTLPADFVFNATINYGRYLDKMLQRTPYADETAALSMDEKRSILCGVYKEAIEDADVITLGIGGNEFNLMSMAMGGRDMEEFGVYPEPESEVGRIYTGLEKRFLDAASKLLTGAKYTDPATPESETVKNVMRVFGSGLAGLTWNTDAVFRQIEQWNPDAAIVYIPCASIIPEQFVVKTADGYEIPIGKLAKLMYDMVAEYHATLSPYAGKIVFADTVNRFPSEMQIAEFGAAQSLSDMSADTKNSVFGVLDTIRGVLGKQDYSGFPQEIQDIIAQNLQKLNAITSVADRAQSGRTFGLIRETYQRGYVSFDILKTEKIANVSSFKLDPQLAADLGNYLVTGMLLGGDEDADRLNAAQGFISLMILYGSDANAVHQSPKGQAAYADAVWYALSSGQSARQYAVTEYRDAVTEFARETAEKTEAVVKEAAEVTGEILKDAAEKTNELLQEAAEKVVPILKEIVEAAAEKRAEVRSAIRDAVESFWKRGR